VGAVEIKATKQDELSKLFVVAWHEAAAQWYLEILEIFGYGLKKCSEIRTSIKEIFIGKK
jgi:hypothetical protein